MRYRVTFSSRSIIFKINVTVLPARPFLPQLAGSVMRSEWRSACLHRTRLWSTHPHVGAALQTVFMSALQEEKTQKSNKPQKVAVTLWLASMHLILKKKKKKIPTSFSTFRKEYSCYCFVVLFTSNAENSAAMGSIEFINKALSKQLL